MVRPATQYGIMSHSRTRRAPQQPSATDPGFEQKLKEGIAGLNSGKYPTPTAAARALKVCKTRCIHRH